MTVPRRAVSLLVLAWLAGFAACGGSEDATAEIVAVIKRAVQSTDPADCTRLQTQRFLDQSELAKGKAAVKSCREDAKDTAGNPKSVAVSNVETSGDSAAARASFVGGDLDGQALNLRLIRDGEQWKLDHVDSFARFDRGRFLRASERALTRPPDALPKDTATCMVRRFGRLSDAAIQRVFVDADPGRVASLMGPCFVSLVRRELAKQPIPKAVADCVIAQIDKPPYELVKRVFLGQDAEAVLETAARACLGTGSA